MTQFVQPPVMLIHGWGSCFTDTWEDTGITSLFEDLHRECIGIDLLGHGTAPKPHRPDDYQDLGARVRDALPDIRVDAVGFSLGALVLLEELVRTPERFNRVVLAGIGDGVFEVTNNQNHDRILAGLAGTAPEDDNIARLFSQYANKKTNDKQALAAVLNRPRSIPYRESDFKHIMNEVLVVVGDLDFVLPADRLASGFSNGALRILHKTDHFKTPESLQFIDTILEFFGVPT